jgi:hypothetical protein
VRCTEVVEIGYGKPAGLNAAVASAIEEVSGAAATIAVATIADDARLDTGHRVRCLTCNKWVIAGGAAAAIAATVLTIVLLYDKPQKLEVGFDPNDAL